MYVIQEKHDTEQALGVDLSPLWQDVSSHGIRDAAIRALLTIYAGYDEGESPELRVVEVLHHLARE